jgi:H+/Cl- antiporter ClcA
MLNTILFSIILGVFTSLVSIFLTEKITNIFFKKKEFSKNYIMFSKVFYIFLFMGFSIIFSILIGKSYPIWFEESLRHIFIKGYFSTYFIIFFMFSFRKGT